MNMKIEDGEGDDTNHGQGNFDINDPEIDIELPPGAKVGLKDASQDIRMNTDQMNE